MSLASVRPALLALAAALTGLDAVWVDQARPATNDVTRGIVLLSFGQNASIGRDENRLTYVPGDPAAGADNFQATAVGQRVLPWRIVVESLEQGDGDTAWDILETFRLRLRWQSSIDALNAVACGINTTNAVQELPLTVDDHIVSRAALDVLLNATLREDDPMRIPRIVEITGTGQLLPGPEQPLDIVIP